MLMFPVRDLRQLSKGKKNTGINIDGRSGVQKMACGTGTLCRRKAR